MVCLQVTNHDREPCKNGGTDQNAIWEQIHVGPRNHALDGGMECSSV